MEDSRIKNDWDILMHFMGYDTTEDSNNFVYEDKIRKLLPYLMEILMDKEVKRILSNRLKADTEDEEAMDLGFERGIEVVAKLIPTLLGRKRKAIYSMIAIMNEKPIEEIKKQPITITVKQVKELVSDERFTMFFT